MKQAYELFGISEKIANISDSVEDNLKEKFNEYDDVALYNQAKVLNAFKEANISQMHFGKTTGYGYGDVGREAIEKTRAVKK